jgi:hypothetical protein
MVILTTDHTGNPIYNIDKGDNVPFRFYVTRNSSAADLTGKVTYFTLRQYRDSTAVIDNDVCSNSETTGYTGYNLLPTETAALSYGRYEFEVKCVYTSGVEEVIKRGIVNVG